MEILGVGGAELVAIFIIALIVAGPKRMIQWAYIMGKYTAKARALWAESMNYIQQELKEAGMDVELPKEPPTRASLNRQVTKALTPVTKPLQDVLDETRSQVNDIKQAATVSESNGSAPAVPKPAPAVPPPPPEDNKPNLGTWSGGKPLDQ